MTGASIQETMDVQETVDAPAKAEAATEGVELRSAAETGDERSPVNVLYIAGIGRSGSTLLGRTLGGSRGHFPAGEVMRLFGRGMARNELCSCGRPARRCEFWGAVISEVEARTELSDPEAVDRFCRSVTEGTAAPYVFLPWQPREVRQRLGRLRELMYHAYRALERVSGAGTIVDASKNLVWGWMLLDVSGIRVHILHLVRDSRGVSYSFEKRKKRPGDREGEEYMHRYHALTSSVLWNVDNLAAEFLGARADSYQRVRYRDFVEAPLSTVNRVLTLIGSAAADGGGPAGPGGDGSDRPLAPHVEGRTVNVGGQHILAGNPVRFESGRIALEEDLEWQARMTFAKKAMVSAITAPLLRRYGYRVNVGANGRKRAGGGPGRGDPSGRRGS